MKHEKCKTLRSTRDSMPRRHQRQPRTRTGCMPVTKTNLCTLGWDVDFRSVVCLFHGSRCVCSGVTNIITNQSSNRRSQQTGATWCETRCKNGLVGRFVVISVRIVLFFRAFTFVVVILIPIMSSVIVGKRVCRHCDRVAELVVVTSPSVIPIVNGAYATATAYPHVGEGRETNVCFADWRGTHHLHNFFVGGTT
jgi:hypothetical protein